MWWQHYKQWWLLLEDLGGGGVQAGPSRSALTLRQSPPAVTAPLVLGAVASVLVRSSSRGLGHPVLIVREARNQCRFAGIAGWEGSGHSALRPEANRKLANWGLGMWSCACEGVMDLVETCWSSVPHTAHLQCTGAESRADVIMSSKLFASVKITQPGEEWGGGSLWLM